MFKNFYKLLIDAKLGNTNLFDYLAIAEEYSKVKTIEGAVKENRLIKNRDDGTWFLGGPDYVNENGETIEPDIIKTSDALLNNVVCVFYRNLYINFSSGPGNTNNDQIIRICVKDPDEQWRFKNGADGKIDIIHPENVNAEVYIDYNVSVLNHSRCVGNEYKSGTWNKMFYRTICSFIDTVQGYTEINRIKKAYENER